MGMFYDKSWAAEADTVSGIGTGWVSVGNAAYITGGAVAPSDTNAGVTRLASAVDVASEIYAQLTISALGAGSEVGPLVSSSPSSTEIDSSYLHVRYDHSRGRIQLMQKPVGTLTLTGLTTVTMVVAAGDLLGLSVHAGSAQILLNGAVLSTTVISSVAGSSTWLYPGFRLRSDLATRISSFKAADYGVTTSPGGGTVVAAAIDGLDAFTFQGSGLLAALEYVGLWNGTSIDAVPLAFQTVWAPIVFDQSRYGPDPTMANPPVLPSTFLPLRTVNVSTLIGLQAALMDATAGDLIELAAGTYNGKFVLLDRIGTADAPIVVRGPKEAIVRLGETDTDYGSGYTAAVDRCPYVWLVGFTIEHGPKGLMVDESTYGWYKGLTVRDVEAEAFHWRNNSSSNIAEDCTIHTTGRKSAGFGEAMYVGTAKSNWAATTSRTGGLPDLSHDNVIRRCRMYEFTGEGVDIKEGTLRTLVEYCHFDGSWLNNDNSADTWIDVKGNDCIIQHNYGQTTFNGAFSVYNPATGYGEGNIFRGNVGNTRNIAGNPTGVAIEIKTPEPSGNVVYDDNVFTGSSSLTDITVTAA